ncbi:glycosyltransferase family protein [Limosilactobacillus reuteri]|uniref:Glycosyltransferase RgtA/B/C/D-like domain-containing protein n=3 Tax=Limosilactobacillus reuteri TaxID=1598 RepID=B3XNU5_LIMR1|nr:hypothetical protein [Limosilactobacillus reuteri]EDX42753.1 conserved hypothetical protein [Limosilactobacillus reuteri subsp. rodentium]MCC4476648.1 hypothetical protein [Limosilactobacillus reuteri]
MNLRSYFTNLIDILLILLLSITFIGSVSSIYGQLQFANATVVLILVLIYFLFGIILYFFPQVVTNINKFMKMKNVFILISVLTIIWQLLLVIGISGNTAWDPSIITTLAAHKSIESWYPDYFSYNPNNFFLLLLERSLNDLLHLVGITSYPFFIIVLGVISYFLIDIAIFILFIALKRIFNRRVGILASFFTWILLALSPLGVIPYSDIPAFFISCLFLYLYSLPVNYQVLINLGILSGIAFLIKPSLIIFDIALLIGKSFDLKKAKNPLKMMIVFALSFSIIYVPFNFYKSHNSVVQINSSKTIPANHFIAMGMTGNGGYNNDDVLANHRIKKLSERKKYNNRIIIRRLKKMGVAGYIKFLVLKQINNTSDAGFGWGMDAGQNYLVPFSEKISIQRIMRKIYLHNQSYVEINWNGLKILNQLIWTLALVFMIFATIKVDNSLVIKLTILGGFIFLLLFEGGRSRYLIQFLPYLITLSSLGISQFLDKKIRKNKF